MLNSMQRGESGMIIYCILYKGYQVEQHAER